jgi:ankyrin repeat protein
MSTMSRLLALLLVAFAVGPASANERHDSEQRLSEARQLVFAGDTAAFRRLLASDQRRIRDRDAGGSTLLMYAAFRSDLPAVRAVLERGADLNATDLGGATALHQASRPGGAPVVEMLLDHGALLEAQDRNGQTALDWAAELDAADVARLLLARHANANGGRSAWDPIHYFARHGELDLVNSLLAAGARADAQDPNGETPLFWVARGGATQTEERVMAHLHGVEPTDYSRTDSLAQVADLLIARGCDVNFHAPSRSGGHTALHAAAKTDRADVAEVLLTHGADPNARESVAYHQYTPLMYAAEAGSIECARLLIAHGAEIDAVNVNWTPLMVAADHGDAAMVALLIEHGANVNWHSGPSQTSWFTREDFTTPLEMATRKGSLETVVLLLKAGADPNPPKKHGASALELARKGNHQQIADTLIAHGAGR